MRDLEVGDDCLSVLFDEEDVPVKTRVDNALNLNLDSRPRMMRNNSTVEIKVHERKQADQLARMWVLHTAKVWGWQDESLDGRKRMKIARAACHQVAYDFGYEMPFSAAQLKAWDKLLQQQVNEGVAPEDASSPRHAGRRKYCDIIEGL